MAWMCEGETFDDEGEAGAYWRAQRYDPWQDPYDFAPVEVCDRHTAAPLEDDGDGFRVCLECQHGECSGCGGPVAEGLDGVDLWAEWCPVCTAVALTRLGVAWAGRLDDHAVAGVATACSDLINAQDTLARLRDSVTPGYVAALRRAVHDADRHVVAATAAARGWGGTVGL